MKCRNGFERYRLSIFFVLNLRLVILTKNLIAESMQDLIRCHGVNIVEVVHLALLCIGPSAFSVLAVTDDRLSVRQFAHSSGLTLERVGH